MSEPARLNLSCDEVKCMKIKAIIHREEGGYWAEVPDLPGCITEGDTLSEVMENLQDAVEGWLSVAMSEIK